MNGCSIVVSEQLMEILCFLDSRPYSQFNLTVAVICDCKDFYFYQLIHYNNHITLFDGFTCRAPLNLYNMKVIPDSSFVPIYAPRSMIYSILLEAFKFITQTVT
jgi:hypothetical protein